MSFNFFSKWRQKSFFKEEKARIINQFEANQNHELNLEETYQPISQRRYRRIIIATEIIFGGLVGALTIFVIVLIIVYYL